ncbi:MULTISPECIES: ROK family transcriptional regulator [Spirosoma]|uniref:ROK family protein n=1 Tax=Spirosoma liriopis TaxID=2937440 RepID=A0ABT0HQS1_9BACT|nr:MULTISPECIES: ROK family transcriptional regulator [Spirosoma]MCK8494518.1 ROK family protein [Spirosoma liriopis]UHG89526.1 ROK family protein [Spirosoma oryzicola]
MNSALFLDEDLPISQSVVDYKKKQKQRKVLAHLYAEGNCTLAHLAKLLHSSVPSVTSLVDELVSNQWVTAIGTATGNNGRRPALFSLNTSNQFVAILDISTHDTKIIFMDSLRKVVFRRDYDLRLVDNPAFLSTLVRHYANTLADSEIDPSDVLAVGISMPGLVDARRGLNLTYKNLSQVNDSLPRWFSEQLQKPVYLINDTKATVLGESRFGRAKGKKQVLAINIDWGVGLGIVVNGEVFQGTSGFAGELGHIQVDPAGELCYCGKIGCLNTITSASALVRRVQRDITDGQISKLATFRDTVDQIDIDELINAAHQGDSYAIDMLHETGYQLGKGLAVAISLFNPEMIVVDGILTKAASFILNTIEQAISKYCLFDFRNDLTIEITQLNGTAKWLGTHAYVMEDIFATY